MDTTILFLTDQLNELELDKLRLGDGDDGAEASGLSSADADNNDVADCQQLAGGDQQTGRSDTGSVRFEKLRKDTVNQSCIGGSEVVNHQLGLRNQLAREPQYTGESFYSHFPSYGNQNKQREQLVSNRHQDYRDHLSKIAEKEATEVKRKHQVKQDYDDDHREVAGSVYDNPISGHYASSNCHQIQSESQANESPTHNATAGSPIDHEEMLNGLKHTSTLADGRFDSQTSGIIKDSNEEHAKEVARKKMEYHRDLQKQIEEKKQEVKALRARDMAEDEEMNKRLEDQLKSIQLEEELRRERKRSEQLRITTEQNHIYRMHLLAQLDQDATSKRSQQQNQQQTPPPPWPRSTDRSQTNGHRWTAMHQHYGDEDTGGGGGGAGPGPADDSDAFDPFDPRRAYKYFSNSARPQPQQQQQQQQHAALPFSGEQPYKSFQAFELVREHQPTGVGSQSQRSTGTQSTDLCKRCLGNMRNASTNTIQQQQQPAATVCQYCERRRHNLPIYEDFCLKCSALLGTQTERQNGLCAPCRRTDLRCGFCQKHIDVCPTCGAVFCLRCHRRQLRSVDEAATTEAEEDSAIGTYRQVVENEENVRPTRPRPPQRPVRKQQAHTISTCGDDRPIIVHARNAPAQRVRQPQVHRPPVGRASSPPLPPPPDSDSEHDLPASIGQRIQRHADTAPFSTNVPHTSIFHPKARIDAPQLAVNIRHGQVFVDEQASKYTTSYDAFPVPLMPQPSKATTTMSTVDRAFERQTSSLPPPSPTRRGQQQQQQQQRSQALTTGGTGTVTKSRPSPAVRQMQQKWEIPVVQKNVITTRRPSNPTAAAAAAAARDSDHRVLTQLGAIRRQLQLEQMELDDNHN